MSLLQLCYLHTKLQKYENILTFCQFLVAKNIFFEKMRIFCNVFRFITTIRKNATHKYH